MQPASNPSVMNNNLTPEIIYRYYNNIVKQSYKNFTRITGEKIEGIEEKIFNVFNDIASASSDPQFALSNLENAYKDIIKLGIFTSGKIAEIYHNQIQSIQSNIKKAKWCRQDRKENIDKKFREAVAVYKNAIENEEKNDLKSLAKVPELYKKATDLFIEAINMYDEERLSDFDSEFSRKSIYKQIMIPIITFAMGVASSAIANKYFPSSEGQGIIQDNIVSESKEDK